MPNNPRFPALKRPCWWDLGRRGFYGFRPPLELAASVPRPEAPGLHPGGAERGGKARPRYLLSGTVFIGGAEGGDGWTPVRASGSGPLARQGCAADRTVALLPQMLPKVNSVSRG